MGMIPVFASVSCTIYNLSHLHFVCQDRFFHFVRLFDSHGHQPIKQVQRPPSRKNFIRLSKQFQVFKVLALTLSQCFVSCKSRLTFVLRGLQKQHYGLSIESPNCYGFRACRGLFQLNPQFRCRNSTVSIVIARMGFYFHPYRRVAFHLCEQWYRLARLHAWEFLNVGTHAHTRAGLYELCQCMSIAECDQLSNCDYITGTNSSRTGTYNISNGYMKHKQNE